MLFRDGTVDEKKGKVWGGDYAVFRWASLNWVKKWAAQARGNDYKRTKEFIEIRLDAFPLFLSS